MIVDPDFPDHWKTRMLVDLLDGDEAAPVYVLRLWAHCQSRRQSVFESLPSAALKALCRFPGHANQLESSLASSGFVRRDDAGVLIVNNWDEYNASLVANWANGQKGGRPKKPIENPSSDSVNPSETDREERCREVKKGGDRKRAAPLAWPLPPELESAALRDALQRWERHRREIRKPLTQSMADAQVKRFAGWGAAYSVEVIDYTIGQGWQGLREPESGSKSKPVSNPFE